MRGESASPAACLRRSERVALVPRSERGVALLLALFVVTLVSVVVIEFTYSTAVDAHVSRNALGATQAHYLARSGVSLAELALRVDAEQKTTAPQLFPPVETLNDAWARPVPPVELGNGIGLASYTIVDESAKLNLNSLSLPMQGNPSLFEMRKQLVQAILEGVGADPNLVFPLVDWIDADDNVERASGAEQQYYAQRTPPYRPRNGPLLSFEEIASVRGFEMLTRAQWVGLERLVTVLPTTELRLNVNTASVELLNLVGGALGAGGFGDAVAGVRETAAIESLVALNQVPGFGVLPPLVRSIFDVRSTHFRIHAVGEAGDARRGLAVTVERPRAATKLTVLDWREEAASVSLTSMGSSGAIGGPAF
jgi:general secretion pathway protein K